MNPVAATPKMNHSEGIIAIEAAKANCLSLPVKPVVARPGPAPFIPPMALWKPLGLCPWEPLPM